MFSATHVNQSIDFTSTINRVLNRQHFILGEELGNFEKKFAQYIGVDHCLGVANGTDALELALKALDVKKNDPVVCVANAGFYSSTAIHAVGAVPMYVDIDPSTLSMSIDALALALTNKPKAIIVTHLYGQLAQIEELVRLSNLANVPLIEDCAQAHGARRNNKLAGSFGRMGCFSFYPTKNLGAIGDAGAVVTSNRHLAERISSLRQYGWSNKYQVTVPGGRNSRLDEIQAAILSDKLLYLDQHNDERRMIAMRYNQAFAELPITCPISVDTDYVAHLYVLRLNQRDQFRAFLARRGISTDVHYPVLDYNQSAYPKQEDLEISKKMADKIVSIPCFPGLDNEAVEHIISAVLDYFKLG